MNPSRPTGPSRLILPRSLSGASAAPSAEAPESGPPRKVTLPAALAREVRALLGDAREVGERLQALLDRGQAGMIALTQQKPVNDLLHHHQSQMIQSLTANICQIDRTNLIHIIQQVAQNELTRESVQLPLVKIDSVSYQKAISDVHAVLQRVEPPQLNVGLSTIEVDLGEDLPGDSGGSDAS